MNLVETVPMRPLFRECVKVLDERLTPIHYKSLATAAVKGLGYFLQDVSMFRVIEDVREKLLIAEQDGTAYLRKPHCLAVKKSWFQLAQADLFVADEIRIPGDVRSGITGAFELLMRPMVQKNPNASWHTVAKARARGKVIEHHVVDWFKARWPMFFLDPSNHGIWDRPASDDFRLSVDGRVYDVDVMGPDRRGEFGLARQKPTADYHLMCEPDGPAVIWKAVAPREMMGAKVEPLLCRSPLHMAVWLNCRANGIDYVQLRDELNARPVSIIKREEVA